MSSFPLTVVDVIDLRKHSKRVYSFFSDWLNCETHFIFFNSTQNEEGYNLPFQGNKNVEIENKTFLFKNTTTHNQHKIHQETKNFYNTELQLV